MGCAAGDRLGRGPAYIPRRRVDDPDPLSVRPETRADDATGIMLQHGLRHLPVLDGKQLCGVIRLRDLLAARIRRPSAPHDPGLKGEPGTCLWTAHPRTCPGNRPGREGHRVAAGAEVQRGWASVNRRRAASAAAFGLRLPVKRSPCARNQVTDMTARQQYELPGWLAAILVVIMLAVAMYVFYAAIT